jgi:hypothetical protein
VKTCKNDLMLLPGTIARGRNVVKSGCGTWTEQSQRGFYGPCDCGVVSCCMVWKSRLVFVGMGSVIIE